MTREFLARYPLFGLLPRRQLDDWLRAKVTLGPQGLTLELMERLEAEIGLACKAVRVSADQLQQVSLAAIAHLSNGH